VQWLICAAILTGAIIAWIEDHTWATALIAGAALVLAAFAGLLVALKQRACDRATELIVEGREMPPTAAVQR
jgi:disulfide bond formation protein DsbB